MSKYTLELSGQLDDVLGELAAKEGVTKAQVLRKSLTLLKVVEDNKALGYEPTMFKEGQPAKQILV